jgi:flagellar biosynthesis protein FlhA
MALRGDKAIAAAPSLEAGLSGTGLGKVLAHNDVAFAVGLAVVLVALLLPLPTFVLDLLLSCSVAVSLATLVITLSARESIEFSTFPSLLLFLTLFRLSLNVASTRLILMQADAGQIIYAFGNFVVAGDLVIGLVVFLILVVIQFVVITKGAERISEVAARFNLDAMPGKQMAIDADLNAGTIGEEDARARRQKIVKESEFYGAMDGASKFIRGDAIAGLIITAVNLLGGFIVGLTRGLSAKQSIATYSILAVGDALVTQIPALIVSTSSGFLISKTSTQSTLSQDLLRQFLARSRPLGIAAFLLGGLVLVPGLPKIPFAVLAVATGLVARTLAQGERKMAQKPAPRASADDDRAPVEELLDVDQISIQVGPRLVRTLDPRRKDSVSHRINPLRKKFAQQYGIVLPLVRLRDNLTLPPSRYEIRLRDHVVSSGDLEPDKFLAMDPGMVREPIAGAPAEEPVFRLPALWIGPDQKEQAELRGYTVVDPETVLITHLSETLRRHAGELISRDDVQKLVDRLRQKHPALVNGVVPEVVPMALLHRVLQNLLKDGIPIRDLATILEALSDLAARTKDPGALTAAARRALVRTITEHFSDTGGKIQAIVLDPAVEYELRGALGADGSLALPPERTMELARNVAAAWKQAMEKGLDRAVLLADDRLRMTMASMLARPLPQLSILAYDEIAIGTKIENVAAVTLSAPREDLLAAGAA